MPRFYAVLQETERVFTSGDERITRPQAAVAYLGPHKGKANAHLERVESEDRRGALAQIDVDDDAQLGAALEERLRRQTKEWRS